MFNINKLIGNIFGGGNKAGEAVADIEELSFVHFSGCEECQHADECQPPPPEQEVAAYPSQPLQPQQPQLQPQLQPRPRPHAHLPEALAKKIEDGEMGVKRALSRHLVACTGAGSCSQWDQKWELTQLALHPSCTLATLHRHCVGSGADGRAEGAPDSANVMISLCAKDRDDWESSANDTMVKKSNGASALVSTSQPLQILDFPSMTWFNFSPTDDIASVVPRPIPTYTHVILICAHKKRDKRCAVASELLMKEFSEQLQALRLREKVAVYPCSHIGGHKWAGTLIVYPQGDWYGRVTTCHVKPLLEQAVLEGKIIKEIWRGRGTLPLKK